METTQARGGPLHVAAPGLPPELSVVQLVDASSAAAVGDVSPRWWLQKVSEGVAPSPVIRERRLTRWSAQDVKAFWSTFGRGGAK